VGEQNATRHLSRQQSIQLFLPFVFGNDFKDESLFGKFQA
jgi:hypothetical protein